MIPLNMNAPPAEFVLPAGILGWSETTQLNKIVYHVRLIEIAGLKSDLHPLRALCLVRQCQGALKSSHSAEELGR